MFCFEKTHGLLALFDYFYLLVSTAGVVVIAVSIKDSSRNLI